MIAESYFYKNELLRIADRIDSWHTSTRWTDRRALEYERDIFYSFFAIRRLIESKTVSDQVANRLIPLQRYPSTGKGATLINRHRLEDLYDLSSPVPDRRPLPFVGNQLIHSYVFSIWVERSGRQTSIFFSSDRHRNRAAFRMTRRTLVQTLRAVGRNYPARMSARFEESVGDYIVSLR
jgi:hypothetical protein